MTSRHNPTQAPSTSTSSYSFESFVRGWFHRQEQLLAEITAADKGGGGGEEAVQDLISRALAHFEEYYEHKSRATVDNVFQLFSPNWCSSFECAYLWVAGFRPGVLLNLVSDLVRDLSPSQIQALHSLKKETRMEEKHISEDLARIQVNTAAPPIIHSLRAGPRSRSRRSTQDGPTRPTTNDAISQLKVVLEEVVANSDTLRMTTAASVAEILTPPQGLRFLAAFIRLVRDMRSLGIERDGRSCRGRSSS